MSFAVCGQRMGAWVALISSLSGLMLAKWPQSHLIPGTDAVPALFFFLVSSVFVGGTMRGISLVRRMLGEYTLRRDAILESGLFGFARVRERRIIWANHHLERLLGYGPGEMFGLQTRDIYADDSDYEAIGAEAYAVMRDGGSHQTECLMRRRDGTHIWMELSGTLADKAAAEVLLILVDINARKRAEAALRTSASFLARTGAAAGVGGWEYDLHTSKLIWSDETCRLHDLPPGYPITPEEALGFYTHEARPIVAKLLREAITQGAKWDVELPVVSAKGRTFYARAFGGVEYEHGRPARLTGAIQDVTARRATERQLAESHELMRVTLNSIADAVITTDLKGNVEWLNPVAERLTGWPVEDSRGKKLGQIFSIVNEPTGKPVASPVTACLNERGTATMPENVLLRSRAGSVYAIKGSASPIRDDKQHLLGAVLVFHDVSEQRRLNKEMTYRATHDLLTGLLNRAEFESRLAMFIGPDKASETHALMYIDLDEFKTINDSCGHHAGDEMLTQVSALLRGAVRERDIVARLGGDEFGLLLIGCDVARAQIIAQKICAVTDQYRFIHDDKRFRIGTSIGLVPVDGRWPDISTLMKAADIACYAAKEAGRGQVYTWTETDNAISPRHGDTQWVHRLQMALDENQFELFAQQIKPLTRHTDQLNCEILLRLRGPDGAYISPGIFLPAAERYHLATRIDRWVVQNVFATLGTGGNADGFEMISINLSGKSVGDPSFRADLLAMINAATFDIRKICFEITETAAIINLLDAEAFIGAIRRAGARVALDDFGAGAASFGYLKALAVDFLKIDGQFVTNLREDRLNHAAVRCFIEIAQVIGIRSIAEHVETAEVLDMLQSLGIDMVQGYLMHRPEPFIALIASTQTHDQMHYNTGNQHAAA
ncbi:MAG: EAL domain-containing protein [Acidocella sp.]|nr:EAL domain-containing protein [Acidocella sp.]